jgi:hypothetical protein
MLDIIFFIASSVLPNVENRGLLNLAESFQKSYKSYNAAIAEAITFSGIEKSNRI